MGQAKWGQFADGSYNLGPNGEHIALPLTPEMMLRQMLGPSDRNHNGIDDREEEWTNPDGSKYKRKHHREPVPTPPPPTPNVFAGGGQVNMQPMGGMPAQLMNPMHNPQVLEMMARGIGRRARAMLTSGVI